MNEIVLKQDIIDSFLQHGEKDYPFECCGFILGHFIDEKSVGTEYIAIPNTKEENKPAAESQKVEAKPKVKTEPKGTDNIRTESCLDTLETSLIKLS